MGAPFCRNNATLVTFVYVQGNPIPEPEPEAAAPALAGGFMTMDSMPAYNPEGNPPGGNPAPAMGGIPSMDSMPSYDPYSTPAPAPAAAPQPITYTQPPAPAAAPQPTYTQPAAPYTQPAAPYTQPAAPAPQQPLTAAAYPSSVGNHLGSLTPKTNISMTDSDQAAKYAKFAVSSLQYNDVPTAVENLIKALQLTTT